MGNLECLQTDGWWATSNAFKEIFPSVVTILCFLHGFLKICDRCRKTYDFHQQIWNLYRTQSKEAFYQALADFQTWFDPNNYSETVGAAVTKLCHRAQQYALSYDHRGCHRISNLVDRLMNRLTRLLYAGGGLHGHQQSSELRLRSWALLHNFRPFAPRSGQIRTFQSPVHRLNQKLYHPHWLHNLQVYSSCQGFRALT